MGILNKGLLSVLRQWLPTLLLALGAVVLPVVCTRTARGILRRLHGHLTEWLYILLDAYVFPTAQIVRAGCVYGALAALPPVRGIALYQSAVFLIFTLFVIFFAGLGAWRAAPICRLLLCSAENRLDLNTHKTLGRFFENIFRALVAVFTVIAMLDRFGVPVTGLLTGAGVVGLAISLAAQSTLSSLIAGITLVLEHPFGIGDYIVLGSYEGTVEDISFRSTKLRTMDNVVISVENSKVCDEYIQNCNQRTSRLWEFTLGLPYNTPREKLDTLAADLAAMLQAQDGVRENGVSVTVNRFGESTIDLLARVYVTTLAYNDFLALKNRLNLKILELMQAEGCEFAFPTVTVNTEE